MESTAITLIFRIPAILIGFLLAFFSFQIYRHTKGATRGWFYLSIFGMSLFLWSGTATIFKALDLFYLRIISGTVFLLGIAFFLPYALVRLIDDWKMRRPRWLTPGFVCYFIPFVLALILLLNAFRGGFQTLPWRQVLSVAHFTLTVSVIFSIIPSYYLMIRTRKSPWILTFIYMILIGIALDSGVYYDGCCGSGGQLEKEEICAGYDLDYVSVYDFTCYEGIIGFAKTYQLFLLVGIIIADIAFYQLWRALA